ncbi:MAG: AI-2E family transporter [Bacteroidota bacterium]
MWTKVPFYLRATITLFGLCLVGVIIVLGNDILVPVAFAILLSMLLLPMNNWLEKKRIPRVGAIIFSLLVAFIVIMGVLYFLSIQIAAFVEDMPSIKKNLLEHAHTLQMWVYKTFHITGREQSEYFNNAAAKIKEDGVVASTLLSVKDGVVLMVLLPIYTFLILYYRPMIRKFCMDIFADRYCEQVTCVLNKSKSIVQSFMVGLMIEMSIVAVLNSIGFIIIGIDYAIFLAVLAAVLNLIPYIGMLIANVFCMLVTLTTSTHFSDILWVFVVLAVVQFVDNNILMPRIVGGKVKINSLVTILGVLIGGALCGISGMFLAIPSIAILKTILEQTDGLKPWGMLLGDEITQYEPSVIYRRLTTWRQKPKAIIPEKVELPPIQESGAQ